MSRARLLLSLVIGLALLAPLAPGHAHHTFVTKFDGSKTIRLAGVVTSVSYSNPHIHFQVQVGGTTWTVETESISAARGHGLTQNVLKAGAKVTIAGWPARDGSPALGLHSISISGGPSMTMRRTAH
ncbi:MAG TPA: DUF6152 family protein [Hyphomicrobiaceae bacterium]|nr:DUF6152 family protein [Hyphomicrobiaceae bacterium]